ncbi:hypothetical protein N8979_00420 [bacterium]|nr:hypothetical protein [bacterium]
MEQLLLHQGIDSMPLARGSLSPFFYTLYSKKRPTVLGPTILNGAYHAFD